MITLIILIVLVAIGGYLTTTHKYEILGVIMCVAFGSWLLIHCLYLGVASYRYELFVEKRNAFEQTLKSSRENGNEYETAAIVKEIAEWNIELSLLKYDNKTIYFDQYVDDRIELLEPIK